MKPRINLAIALLSLAFSFSASAETMEFTYVFTGADDQQPWASGATLTVEIDGTVQSDGDTVTVNAIRSATLERPDMAPYVYASVETDEIETSPAGATPIVSFSGNAVNLVVCPAGFTTTAGFSGSLDSCLFDVDGGFSLVYDAANFSDGNAIAVDDRSNCLGQAGCPVTDDPMDNSAFFLDGDGDSDGAIDSQDNCPDIANFQLDIDGFADGDGYGDACEIGDMQSFSDGGRPYASPAFNGIPTSCVVNGWLVFNCAAAVVEGENGPGDNALFFSSEFANKRNFNFLTWEEYPHADTRFLGDYLDAEVTALRFKARHVGGDEPLVLRVMVTDTFDDGGSDFAISTETAVISVGSDWTTYEISLDKDDLELGTRLFGDRSPGPPRRTADDILGAVAQFSLRHDPTGAGPGTSAPTTAEMEIDDIELVGGGSTGFAFLLALSLLVYRRSKLNVKE